MGENHLRSAQRVRGPQAGAGRLNVSGLLERAAAKLFRVAFGVETHGVDNLRKAGERAVIVVNHVSFLDAPLLAAFLPGRLIFAIDSHIARLWWVRPFLALGVVDTYPVNPADPLAMRGLIRAVRQGRHCVVFPEGRITVTGALMKIYEGPALIADKADARIVPVRIDGAQLSHFSRLRGKWPLRLFPKITITVLPPRDFDIPEGARGRARRRKAGDALYDIMSAMMFETDNRRRQTLFEALLDARKVHGAGRPVVDDIERDPIGYGRLLLGAGILERRFAAASAPGETVGLMLPNAKAAAVAFFALQAAGRVTAMLNFTAGAANLVAACRAAEVRIVYTSRRFVQQARLDAVAETLGAAVKLVYLEDLRETVSFADRLRALVDRRTARRRHRRLRVDPDAAAVVLFTSGTEGTPKGVVLSHANLLANCRQLASRVDFGPSDLVFGALPLFHAFGLLGGLLLPLLYGVRTFLYPSPLHYRIVPELAYATNATIMFGTDTFLTGYARVAHPYDFYSMRYVFAGAERVRPETRDAWTEKFGIRLLEGYGATECAPVIAVNTPMHHRSGTVGRLLPGIAHRIEPVEGIEEGGRLLVAGPNVMRGYLHAERPGVLEPPGNGWYDTGDIVAMDGDGFVRILGRAKRFAKVGGEMVSLGAVERLVGDVWPESGHAVIALPDPRRGEQLVLLTERADASREALAVAFRRAGAAELMLPRTIVRVERLPVLGSGKTDYGTAKAIAEERATAAAAT